jgi:hypothetical protein
VVAQPEPKIGSKVVTATPADYTPGLKPFDGPIPDLTLKTPGPKTAGALASGSPTTGHDINPALGNGWTNEPGSPASKSELQTGYWNHGDRLPSDKRPT